MSEMYSSADFAMREAGSKIVEDSPDTSCYMRMRQVLGRLLIRAADAVHAIECHEEGDFSEEQSKAELEKFFSSLDVDPYLESDAQAFRAMMRIMKDTEITRLTAEVERLREDYLDLRHSNCDEWIDRVSAMGQEVSKCGCGRPAAHFTQDGAYLCCSCHHGAEMIAISEETRTALEGKEA